MARLFPKRISLALQGGGSHGAFTWGVLDRLLEEERIRLDGVSGASAGAINAALLASGLTEGGRKGARRALDRFWVSIMTSLPNPAIEALVMLTRFLAPAQFNPLNLNPLRDLLAAQVDFERLRRECRLELFVAATEVASGMPRIFRTHEMCAEVLLASACLPTLHHPVEIDGTLYWDGGLTANPPLRPLIYECSARDLVLVLLGPRQPALIPKTAEEILRRFSEISFSASLYSELQGIALAKQAAERRPFSLGGLERRLRALNLHAIGPTESVNRLAPLSRFETHAAHLRMLREEGRAQADAWLQQKFESIGERSTLSFNANLLPVAG
jgi:NTE family protein